MKTQQLPLACPQGKLKIMSRCEDFWAPRPQTDKGQICVKHNNGTRSGDSCLSESFHGGARCLGRHTKPGCSAFESSLVGSKGKDKGERN